MKYKIIYISLISLGLSFGLNTFAATRLSVPEVEPLQPIPQGAGPNISNNINTTDSEANKSLQSQIPSQSTEPNKPIPTSTVTEENVPGPADPIIVDVPATHATFYWILFFVGIGGLMSAGLWVYIRFMDKSKT